jgi:hypothetical protein
VLFAVKRIFALPHLLGVNPRRGLVTAPADPLRRVVAGQEAERFSANHALALADDLAL